MSGPTSPDDPTQIYRPVGPPASGPPASGPPASGPPPPPPPPTQVVPATPPPPRDPGINPWLIALAVAVVALIAGLVALAVSRHHSTKPSTTTTSATTAATTTTPPTTSPQASIAPVTLPALPSTTSAPTTSSTSTVAGNRPPTSAEAQAIRSDVPPPPNATIDLIRIADSDSTWAVQHVSPAPGHEQDVQSSYSVLHKSSGTWTKVASGTAQVDCGGNVPANVVADFANILGTC